MMRKLYQAEQTVKVAQLEVKEHKQRLRKEFRKNYKQQLKVVDIIAVCIILMNFGALFLTNMLVTKKEIVETGEQPVFYEANPVTAEQHDFEPAPKEMLQSILPMVIKFIVMWSVLIFVYIWYRFNIYTPEGLIILYLDIAFYFFILGLDFVNDLGLYLGTII